MDRNQKQVLAEIIRQGSLSARRAWIEIYKHRIHHKEKKSLSARRAWIEISMQCKLKLSKCVALRKESVDRNTNFSPASLFDLPSLSARRAWIEISIDDLEPSKTRVALRKESVDRNRLFFITFDLFRSRSPQGERG